MPGTSTTVFICDRDGTESNPITGEANHATNLPNGWVRMNWDATPGAGQGLQSGIGYLCPVCAAAFQEFMGNDVIGGTR